MIEEEVDAEGSWAVSYGDMITLLLTFFILFFSTDVEKDRLKAMEASLLAVFSPPETQAGPLAPDQKLSIGKEKGNEIDPSVASDWGAKVYQAGTRLIVEFPGVSFFRFGDIDLTPEGKKTLKEFSDKFMPYAGNYVLGIRAYTDDRPVKEEPGKRFRDNLELSALRSVSTMRVLQKVGVPLSRMRLGGWGELRQTAEEISRMRAAIGADSSKEKGNPLARKIVLVIEAEIKEKA